MLLLLLLTALIPSQLHANWHKHQPHSCAHCACQTGRHWTVVSAAQAAVTTLLATEQSLAVATDCCLSPLKLNLTVTAQSLEACYTALVGLQPRAAFQPAVHAVLQRMGRPLDFLATASGREDTAPQACLAACDE